VPQQIGKEEAIPAIPSGEKKRGESEDIISASNRKES
jgi:hypothetical protein